jgi:hypothetical protein
MKFAHNYKLNKDLPKYKKGWTVGWDGNKQKFFPHKVRHHDWEDKSKPDIYLDYNHEGYSVEEVSDKVWFTPAGKLVDFIPQFPTMKRLEDFMYLSFETRLVNDVDECRALNDLFNDPKFKDNLYSFIKGEYERKHKSK